MNWKFWKKGESATGASAHLPFFHRHRDMLGAYEVEGELGRGSMGIVYLGREPASGRQVAIKTVYLAAAPGEESWEQSKARYLENVTPLLALAHPDIVKYYAVWEEHETMYVAMEFLDGKELTAYNRPDHLLPLATVLEITARVADALDYTHRNLIVHRDNKPANILYNAASGMVKLVDFGISRPVNHAATRAGVVVGSPPYMSPEQILGRPLDGRSDLYSLGATLYQLASGRLPFEARSEFEMMSKIVQQPHADISTAAPGVPDCVRDIINRALQKKAEDRYQSGSEMAEAIRGCRAVVGGGSDK